MTRMGTDEEEEDEDEEGEGREVMGGPLIHKELSGEIIGAAMTVLNDLKPGLDETSNSRSSSGKESSDDQSCTS